MGTPAYLSVHTAPKLLLYATKGPALYAIRESALYVMKEAAF